VKILPEEIERQCWLRYRPIRNEQLRAEYRTYCSELIYPDDEALGVMAHAELIDGLKNLLGPELAINSAPEKPSFIIAGVLGSHVLLDNAVDRQQAATVGPEGFFIKTVRRDGQAYLAIGGGSERGLLYGVFHFLRLLQGEASISNLDICENPVNPIRMLNHWDNLDGSVERGYAGRSIFFENNQLIPNSLRLREYARLLASVGLNGVAINNVNVHRAETELIAAKLDMVSAIAKVFRQYGIKVYLSINYAAPLELGGLATADPLDDRVKAWWRAQAARVYQAIPDLGGFLVKADSEHRPGPFTYRRNHADGANMLAAAVQPFGGVVIWRCFIYNCGQDWRDRTTDRAKAAYEHFQPLDGEFAANVILQVKNGPMDFQVREPVSPLFGAMPRTNQLLELQITQEYTGQQVHLCHLVPQWKEVLDFDTRACGADTTVKRIVAGSLFKRRYGGMAGVANIGTDPNWTGHTLAQANLFGFARLAWNPDLSAEQITTEWVQGTFGADPTVVATINRILLESWHIYENYTAPLGSGWMVNPGHHYGPNVDGYEYSRWGTYHRADHTGIGVDRSVGSGTGYAGQYFETNAARYETIATCPEELLLFFHHVPYTHLLKNGKTVIQHIYDTHFEGVEQVKELIKSWEGLKDKLEPQPYASVLQRLNQQLEHAVEWRDVINAYFFRKSGIPDRFGRKIY
jgi:alpha-glucuronidase